VECLEEVSDRGRSGQRVPEPGRQGLILAEPREILAAIPAARPERDEALHELRGRQPPPALLDRDLGIDRCRDPELAEQLDHERHPRAARDQGRVNGIVDLERQPRRHLKPRVPSSAVGTHWVTPSKPDAIGGHRLHGGFPGQPFGRSRS